MDDDWATSGVLQKDCFMSAANCIADNDSLLDLSPFDSHDSNDGYDGDLMRIKMEPSDETSDYHGSSSGSPSSSLSSPNNFKDELALDINFCGSFSTHPFSPAAGSSHSPIMMNGGQVSQQHSPLAPVVSHFAHQHLQPAPQHHQNQQQHHSIQMSMNQLFNQQLAPNHHQQHHPHQFVAASNNGYYMKEPTIYDGPGGMGLAHAQQQLKSRNKMHEMAVKQHLITDQSMNASGEVMLSSEERRTLIQEGYPIPAKYPLTKCEEEALKIVRRKIKNKLSAQESRRKRKEYIDALESRINGCCEENKLLRIRVHQLEMQNRDLMEKARLYEEATSSGSLQN